MKIARYMLLAAAMLLAGAAAANQQSFEYHATVEFGPGTANSSAERGCEAAKRKVLMDAAKFGDRWCTSLGLGADVDDIAHRSCRYAYRMRNSKHAGVIVLDGNTTNESFPRGEATAISTVTCQR